ncbi:MAG: hypothetical protein J6A91_04060 [Bacteroidales bacterium]|nr:hypothetical protein [Bacteroidales bacterium]MBP3662976.1 hypothetical protein [Bacteroidales bacterium]
MKRILFAFAAVLIALVGCKNNELDGSLSVSPSTLEFGGDADTLTVTVTAENAWAVKSSATWCTTTPTYGKSGMTVKVMVQANSPKERTAELSFSGSGSQPVIVSVIQAPGTAAEKGESYPDPTSGIEVDPVCPDADSPATIIFKPAADNPLYGHTGELYGHLGVVVEGEWMYVQGEWGQPTEKTHFTKVADNHWELKLEPTVREYFESGETPITKLAIIVRSEDGNTKSHEADQFCSAIDNKYKPVPFEPHPLVTAELPAGAKHGINYNADGTMTFVFYDQDTAKKSHKYCYIVGDWNEWKRVEEGCMKWDPTAGCWWITLGDFDADKEYRFQYRLGNESGTDTYVSDPYSNIVYDQWNDAWVEGAPEFPAGAKALISAFQINQPSYSWKVTDFEVKDKNNLIIYEMLFRDFTETSDIAGATANFDYIKNLGVNAVQLMPIQEFDGNESWGYNPNHYFALDKYYGTREEYKQFIDLCHENGIAVIVDVVYNHATGSHPWAKLWWDGDATADNNPWFNRAPTHPYNVYHDFNHENPMVKEHVKQSLEYLLTEYKVDGFRFDLTKGFTQTKTDPDVGKWGQYDASRVAILKGYADHIWSVNDKAVVIFEHLAEYREELVLAQHGIQLWRNMNHTYREAVGGKVGNFSGSYEQNGPYGGWVSYMESHDEERLCAGVTTPEGVSVEWGLIGVGGKWEAKDDLKFSASGDIFVVKNVALTATDEFKVRKFNDDKWTSAYNWGAAAEGAKASAGKAVDMATGGGNVGVAKAGTYDVYFSPDLKKLWLMTPGQKPNATVNKEQKDITVPMRRAGASAAFFLLAPGPKMIWQFGEIGYDFSIEEGGRTGNKPVVTDKYMANPARKGLYDTYAKLIKFRNDNPEFFSGQSGVFKWNAASDVKTIEGNAGGKKFYVVGNFKTSATTVTVPSGTWKDYFNNGASVSGSITLQQGEFKLLTSF